jgi:hypothetical protein
VLRFFVIITEKLGEGQQERNSGVSALFAPGRGMGSVNFARSRSSSVWITIAAVFAAPKGASPEKFPAFPNLSRQTHEFRNAVSYGKQTTANGSNRQNIQKSKHPFFAAFSRPPGFQTRTTNAPTENEL